MGVGPPAPAVVAAGVPARSPVVAVIVVVVVAIIVVVAMTTPATVRAMAIALEEVKIEIHEP